MPRSMCALAERVALLSNALNIQCLAYVGFPGIVC